MAAPSTCIVSGTLLNVSAVAISGATVRCNITTPFVHTANLIPASQVSTTTAADGTWSLTLIETTTITKSLLIEFEYTDGGSSLKKAAYPIVVPNTPTALFSNLVTLP